MDDPTNPPRQRQLFDLTPDERARLLTLDGRNHGRALLAQLIQAALQTEAAARNNHER